MSFCIFTRDNHAENNWGKCTRMHENEPANTNYKSTAGSSQQSSKQKNGDNSRKILQINIKKKQRDQNSSEKASNCTSKLFQTRRLQTLQNLLSVMKQRWLSFLGHSSFKDPYGSQMLKRNRRHYRAVCHDFALCNVIGQRTQRPKFWTQQSVITRLVMRRQFINYANLQANKHPKLMEIVWGWDRPGNIMAPLFTFIPLIPQWSFFTCLFST